MQSIKVFFFVVLCLTIKQFNVFSENFETMLSSIKVRKLHNDDLFYKKVDISERENLTIYMYSLTNDEEQLLDKNLNVFYIYINCKFSNWIDRVAIYKCHTRKHFRPVSPSLSITNIWRRHCSIG